MRTALILIASLFGAMQIASGTTVLFAGETLRVDFQLAPPVCEGGPCDTLLIFPTADQAFSPVVDSVALFDGETTLGAVTATYAPAFSAPGSLLGPSLAAIVDFTTILDGSIDGSISFTLLSGALSWSGSPGLNLTLGRAIAPGLVMEGSSVVVTNVSIHSDGIFSDGIFAPEPLHSNPEPASIWLAAGGGVTLWLLRRRARPGGGN